MNGLRICMLTTFYPPHNFGGDGIGIQRLAQAFARRGHRVVVVHDVDAYNALRQGPEPQPMENSDGVEVVALRSGLGLVSPLFTQQLGRPVFNGPSIRRLLANEEFDVTIFHNISLVGGPGLLRYGRGVTLYEAHEHWLVCPMHVLWRHNKEACTSRQCIRCTLRFGRPPQIWRYTGLLERQLNNVDAFIAKSEFSLQMHREFGFDRPMSIIPYFLPDDAGAGAGRDPVHDRPFFLFAGRLVRMKGLDEAIPAFRDYPDADLLIAGDGPHGPALRALARSVPNVRFLGRLTPEELRVYYEQAIALLVPTVGVETFGIILIEAFRQGTPVIARRAATFPELVAESGGGLLFDTPAEMLHSMRTLQHDPALRDRLGESGRDAFVRNWTEGAVLPRYLDLIRSVAERKGRHDIVDQIVEYAG
jgi:glycosyltransferase involved in cell wall biosynthesis